MKKSAPVEQSALTVEMWPIEKLVAYARNARSIPQSAIDKVAASVQEFGWRQPIVVDSKGVIVAGHTRLLAAQKLGLKEVPVHVADNLTPAQIKAYRLMDNRSHDEAAWMNDLLGLELEEIRDLDEIDLALTGFSEEELLTLLAGGTDEASTGEGDGTPEAAKKSLAERFGVPPFSVLDARQGYWQDRKRAWLSLGIKSELGRGDAPIGGGSDAAGSGEERGGA